MKADPTRQSRPFNFKRDPHGLKGWLSSKPENFYSLLAKRLGVSVSHLRHVIAGTKKSLRVESALKERARQEWQP